MNEEQAKNEDVRKRFLSSLQKVGDAFHVSYSDAGNVGFSTRPITKWKSKYGGMEASDLKRNRELEAENAKLKADVRGSRGRKRRVAVRYLVEAASVIDLLSTDKIN